jgi:hypothetical protein
VNKKRALADLNAMWAGMERSAEEASVQKVYKDTQAAFDRNIKDAFRDLEATGDPTYAMKLINDAETGLPPALAAAVTGPYKERIGAVRATGLIKSAPFNGGDAREEADLAVKAGLLTRADADTAVSSAMAAVRRDAAETAEGGLAAYRQAFEETGSVAAARDAAYSTETRTEEAKTALHDGITRAQSANLATRYETETAGATLDELRKLAGRYGKKGEYAADFRAEGKKNGGTLEQQRKQYEATIRDRINREEASIAAAEKRLKAERAAAAKAERSASAAADKDRISEVRRTADLMQAQWQAGQGEARDGMVLLDFLKENEACFDSGDYMKRQNAAIFGRGKNEAVKEVFSSAQRMFKDTNVPDERRRDMEELLMEAVLRGRDEKYLTAMVERFRQTEAAGFLDRASASLGKNNTVAPKDMQAITAAAIAGKLDYYLGSRTAATAPGQPLRREELTAGGGKTERVMAVLEQNGREVLEAGVGGNAKVTKSIMDRDKDGDPNGWYRYAMSDGNTYRVNSDGNSYFIEVLDGGRWKKAEAARDTRTQRERRGG